MSLIVGVALDDPPSSPQEPNTQESISQPPCQISRAASTLQKTLSPLPVQEDAIMASPVRSISRTKSTDDSEVIECECADNRDDDAMIQCDGQFLFVSREEGEHCD